MDGKFWTSASVLDTKACQVHHSLVIHYSTIEESVEYITLSNFISSEAETLSMSWTNNTAPHNMSRGIVITFNGDTRDVAQTKFIEISPLLFSERAKMQAPYARSEASQNICSCMDLICREDRKLVQLQK